MNNQNHIRSAWFFISTWFERAIWSPTQATEDGIRKERILNVILLFSIALLSGIVLLAAIKYSGDLAYQGLPLGVLGLFLLGYIVLLIISRLGKPLLAASGALFFYTVPTLLAMTYWGVDLPHTWIVLTLIIVMCGVLINAASAFFVSTIFFGFMFILAEAQNTWKVPFENWKQYTFYGIDTLTAGVIFLAIAAVTWLSNREIERSLDRARKSEQALREERDLLEIRVDERTAELRTEQAQRLSELNRFAEFGRLASGIFHELGNPLTAISLNLDLIKDGDRQGLLKTQKQLNNAQVAAHRMEEFIKSARKQLQQQKDIHETFVLNDEIKQVMAVLGFKAREQGVELSCITKEDISMKGSILSFHRVLSNLVSNAIDAYRHQEQIVQRRVEIRITQKQKQAKLQVQDWGSGIPAEHFKDIFKPFFTTKPPEEGTGLGLANVKTIVEQEWQGHIDIQSTVGEGTTFTITFPLEPSYAPTDPSMDE